MKYQKSEGIILKTLSFKESSKIITIYTHDQGMIPFLVKGAKKNKSKFTGKTELFSQVDFVFTFKESRQIQLITDIDILKYYSLILQDYDKIALMGKISALLIEILYENKMIRGLYDLLTNIMFLLEQIESDKIYLVYSYFLVSFLELNGLGLDFESCQICKKKFVKKVYYDVVHSNLVCDTCKNLTTQSLDIEHSILVFLKNYKNPLNFYDTNLKKQYFNAKKILHLCYKNHFNCEI